MSDSPLSMNLYAEDWLKRPLIKVSEFIKDGTHGTHERVKEALMNYLIARSDATRQSLAC